MTSSTLGFRIGVVIFALTVVATAVLALVGWPGTLYRDSDWMQYYAGSSAILEGASPYDHAWWLSFHQRVGSAALSAPPRTGDLAKDWTTPYPMPTFVALLPFALLPIDVAQPLFASTQVALIVASTIALGAATFARPWRQTPLALALVAASQPLWVLVAGGNITGFAAAFFALSVAALLSGRPVLAGALLAGVMLKPHLFVLATACLVVGTRPELRARVLLGAALGAGTLLVPSFIARPGWVGDWLSEAGRLQATSASNATGWTIARPFTPQFRLPSAAVVALVLAVLAIWWRRTRPTLALLVAAALPASLLIAPHGWSYDYITLLPTVVVALGVAATASRRTAALATVALLAVPVPWALYVLAFRRNGEDITTWLLVLAVACYVLLRPRLATATSTMASTGTSPEPVS